MLRRIRKVRSPQTPRAVDTAVIPLSMFDSYNMMMTSLKHPHEATSSAQPQRSRPCK